jgi:hypothetical protein
MNCAAKVFPGRDDDGVLGAPRGHEDYVGGLPFVRESDPQLGNVYVSRWVPDEGELETLKRGGSVLLRVYGYSHPPVSVSVWPAEDTPDPTPAS